MQHIKSGAFISFVNKLTVIAGKLSAQRHLNAVRESFVVLMPLIIAASFFILINNVILHQNGLMGVFGITGGWITELQQIGMRVYNGTLNILTLMATIMIAYKLGKDDGGDGLMNGVLALAALFTLFPLSVPVQVPGREVFMASNLVSGNQTGATGMFVGILVAIACSELFRRLKRYDALVINMPDSVPPAVAKSFNVLIPMLLVLSVFATLGWGLEYVFNKTAHELVNGLIQAPLQNVFQGLGGVISVLLIQNGLWWSGIHGVSIMYPITETTLLVAIQENSAAFMANNPLPHIVTKPFLDSFAFMGGGGQTIGLLISLFIVAKRDEHKVMSKLAAPGTIFNINEPLIFGLPIMFNPILLVPFLLTPVVCATIAYTVTYMGFISKTSVLIPWTTPPVLSAFLATSGDWRAAVLAVLLIGLSVLIYLPFVLAMSRAEQERV